MKFWKICLLGLIGGLFAYSLFSQGTSEIGGGGSTTPIFVSTAGSVSTNDPVILFALTNAVSVGTGTNIFNSISGRTAQFNTIIGSNGVSVVGGNTIVISGNSSAIQSGTTAIGNTSNKLMVTFPTIFATTPSVIFNVSRPSSDPLISVNLDQDVLNTTNFTVTFGAAAPNANYKLHWIAK